jgi:hypothetical protein
MFNRTHSHAWIVSLVGVGLTLILAGVLPLVVSAQEATSPEATPEVETLATEAQTAETPSEAAVPAGAEVTPEPVYQVGDPPEVTGSNSYCMICHNQPWHTVTLPDGSIQNLYVNPDTIAASVHGEDSESGTLGCIDCHGADSFPHDQPTPPDERSYTLGAVSMCVSCHADQVAELEMGLHEEAIRAGNRSAAVCTDCHGAHDVQPVVEEPDLIAGVCGDCHTSTLEEWRVSAHVDIGPLGCATCHSPHSQRLRAGNTPSELCINCHEDMPDIFTHVTHVGSEMVNCTDCHMYTPTQPDTVAVALTVATMPTGHTMRMDTTPCTTCHEQLVSSGEWDRLVAARPAAETAPPDESALTVDIAPGAELAAAEAVTAQSSVVPLIQGLILGLGFGVTFAAVFITRGNRVRSQTTDAHAEPAPAAPSLDDSATAQTNVQAGSQVEASSDALADTRPDDTPTVPEDRS